MSRQVIRHSLRGLLNENLDFAKATLVVRSVLLQ
jgi:hypothetical protein